jgi:hypothetical protein
LTRENNKLYPMESFPARHIWRWAVHLSLGIKTMTSAADDDWRLMGQERWLRGVTHKTYEVGAASSEK